MDRRRLLLTSLAGALTWGNGPTSKGKSMPTNVGREDLQRLVAEGAQLVEVLPKEEFDEQHLRGAIHIPLRRIDRGVRASLAPERPVVVYCWDSA